MYDMKEPMFNHEWFVVVWVKYMMIMNNNGKL
jgi:hypothetical protein